MNSEPQLPNDHETKDVDPWGLFLIGTAICLMATLVLLACWGIVRALNTKSKATEQAAPPRASKENAFPQPRLETEPSADLSRFNLQESQELNSYGWIDRRAGIVRIPIAEAMSKLLAQGLPETGANMTPLQLMQLRPQEGETPTPTGGPIP